MNWKIGIDVSTQLCVKQITNENLVYSKRNSILSALWLPRGVRWGRMGGRSQREGIYVYTWLIHFTVQQKLTQHRKATIPPNIC